MKALTISQPGRTSYTDLRFPAIGVGQLLLKIERIGYCGTDLNTYRGLNPLVSYPRVPGHEIQARIAELGPDVPADFEVGRVVTVLPYTSCGRCGGCLAGRPNACENNQTLGVQREGALTDAAIELIMKPWLGEAGKAAPNVEGAHVMGPAEPPIAVVRGRWRRRFLVNTDLSVDISSYMRARRERFKPPAAVRVAVDIEPYTFL